MFVEFKEPGEFGRTVTINSDHVQSIESSDYDDVRCCRIVLATGEEWVVAGDYQTVVRRLDRAQ